MWRRRAASSTGLVAAVSAISERDFAPVGCALAEAAVRSVGVVVVDIFAEQLFEGSAVPDEGPVAELAASGADPSFRVCVRDRGVGAGCQ
jgi:hypothetical protein